MNNESNNSPTTAAKGVPSVDTPKFQKLLRDYRFSSDTAGIRQPLVVHLNADKAAAVAQARNEGAIDGRVHQREVDDQRIESAEAKVRELEAERGEVVAWMLEFEDERVVTADPKEVEMWRTQHDNPYEVTSLHAFRAAQEAAKPSERFDTVLTAAMADVEGAHFPPGVGVETPTYRVDRDELRTIIARALQTMRAAAPASADVGELPVVGYRIEQRPGDYSFMDAKHWPYNAKHYAGARVHELRLGAMIQNPGVDAAVAAVFPSLWSGIAPSATVNQASSAVPAKVDDIVGALRKLADDADALANDANKNYADKSIAEARKIADALERAALSASAEKGE